MLPPASVGPRVSSVSGETASHSHITEPPRRQPERYQGVSLGVAVGFAAAALQEERSFDVVDGSSSPFAQLAHVGC